MSAAVRRLALDVQPWMWGYFLFLVAISTFLNGLWLLHPRVSPSLMPGMFMGMTGMFSAQKIALWRILPVTRRDIDLARWWQGMGVPALVVVAMMAGPALVLTALHRLHVVWYGVALITLEQFALGIACIVAMTIALPWIGRRWGRFGALIFMPLLLLAYLRTILPQHAALRPGLMAPLAGGGAMLAAFVLYRLAGRWPMPLAVAWWNIGTGDRAPQRSKSILAPPSRFILRGWPVLLLGLLPVFLLLWAATALVPLALKWFLPDIDLRIFGWAMGMAAVAVAVSSAATGLRSLRTLPLNGWQLTLRIAALLLLVQAVSLAIFALVLHIVGEAQFEPVMALAPAVASLVFFPLTLRFGLRVVSFSYALLMVFAVPFDIWSERPGAEVWIVPVSLALMIGGICWSHWEIARGRHAYRIQPLVPQRWHGQH